MNFTGIDLAERHSAAVVVDKDGQVLFESTLDTGVKETIPNPFEKAKRLAPWWLELREAAGDSVFVVEDIPPSRMFDPKPVLKLQGALIGYMVLDGLEAHLTIAKVWQAYFGYSKKEFKDSKKWAEDICDQLCYTPGTTFPEGTKVLAKQKVDLRDAYLLALWLRDLCLGA